MALFLVAVGLLLLAAPLSLLARQGGAFWERASLASLLAGCVAGCVAVGFALTIDGGLSLDLPWSVPGGAFVLAIDGLAAVFLLPAFLLIGAGAIYGVGYWPRQRYPASGSWVRFFYALMAAGIVMLLAAANAVLFLLAWECMALAGYFLVCTEREKEEAQKASFLYLTCTHTGTLALFALFALLIALAGPQTLPAPASLDAALPAGTAVFLLALAGFGLKAGLIPLHIWLPRAHAAAPSHVSALMSGIMIKTGIYGIMRVTTFFFHIPPWWGWVILGLGVVSAVLGVVFAIAQHDIKRLLAYHSVENIGIILLGFGTALLGISYQEPALFALGMAGALLHVVNHGLFKGLLFLSAGSMIHATGSRDMARYGGLLRALPLTGLFFLGGAVAICGLPPLNGFVSEWFVYLGLLHAGIGAAGTLALAVLALPALALTGGLALLCFAKVFGLAFLGAPRAEFAACGRHEAPASMLGGMAMLLAACLWIGLLPSTVLPLLSAGLAAWRPDTAGRLALANLAPTGFLSGAALILLFMIGGLVLLGRLRRPKTACTATWGCGFPFVNPRMQYSVSSFAQLVGDLFQWALRTRRQGEDPAGLFPKTGNAATHTPDAVLDLLLLPLCRQLAALAYRARHLVQHGNLNFYMLQMALALCLLLWLAFA